jgi:hypothetical protein
VTVIDHPTRESACQRGELAARMVAAAVELACLVRDEGRDEITAFIDALTDEERDALLVVQAALIPLDADTGELLSWVTWDEYGRPLPDPAIPDPAPVTARRTLAAPPRPRRRRARLKPCGTYPAYSRHKRRGELIDDDCQAAARAYWAARGRAKRKAEAEAPSGVVDLAAPAAEAA